MRIEPLAAAVPDSIETLLDAAFGADRHRRTAYKLRIGIKPIGALSFGVHEGEALVGSLQCWPIALVGPNEPPEALVMVGPVAVHPDRQRSGIGGSLMRHMLAIADAREEDALMLIGDPEYYGRFFGFVADETGGWVLPGPVERRRVLARLHGHRLREKQGRLVPANAVLATLR